MLPQLAAEIGIPLWLLVVVVLWSLTWKGIAWWHAARKGHMLWFIAFFIVNTVGIFEILYIFLFSKIKFPRTPKSPALLRGMKKNKRRSSA